MTGPIHCGANGNSRATFLIYQLAVSRFPTGVLHKEGARRLALAGPFDGLEECMQTHRRPNSWTERSERREVNLASFASRSDGTRIRVRLLNISYEGCQLATEKPLVVGERIKLGLTGLGEILAEVRWTSKYRAGARFALELPLLAEKRR